MQPSRGNESDRPYKNFALGEIDMGPPLASSGPYYATCYDPVSMAAAGFYAAPGFGMADLEPPPGAGAGIHSMAQTMTGLAAGRPRSLEMAILSGTSNSSNNIGPGMWGFPSDFDVINFLKVEKEEPRYSDVGSNAAQRSTSTYPSATATSSSFSSPTTASTSGGESISSSYSSHATPTSPPSSSSSSSVVFQTDSSCSLADQGTDNKNDSSQDAALDTSVASSSASSSPNKRHLSRPGEQKDESYREKRRKNNESAKRSREARRQKEEQVMLRVLALEDENTRLRERLAWIKLWVKDLEKSVESA